MAGVARGIGLGGGGFEVGGALAVGGRAQLDAGGGKIIAPAIPVLGLGIGDRLGPGRMWVDSEAQPDRPRLYRPVWAQ